MSSDDPMTTLIFDGKDVRILHSLVSGSKDTLIITFTPLVHKDFDPPVGFGQAFFAKRGYDCLCFISERPHWWQVSEIFDALSHAVKISSQYKQVVCYGSSMGAYGALMFSGALSATEIIAAAPQFSIDPAKVEFERRWVHHATKLKFIYDDMNASISHNAKKFIIYDFNSIDRKHVDLIHTTNVVRVGLPLVGHAPLASLAHLDLLKGTILDIIDGTFVAKDLLIDIRDRRRQNPDYWSELAQALYSKRRYQGALAASQRAIALAPDIIKPRLRLAQTHMQLGDIEMGLSEIESAVALRPRHAGARKSHLIILTKAIRVLRNKPDALQILRARYESRIAKDPEIHILFSTHAMV